MSDSSSTPDFVKAMHELLGMDKDAVEDLIEKLNTDQLQDLSDAIAKHDRAAAEKIIGQFDTDEDINFLFRGKNLDDQSNQAPKKKIAKGDKDFSFGNDVLVRMRNDKGEIIKVTGTVSNPQGPEGTDTIIVSIKGKKKVVKKRNAAKLVEDGIMGMMTGMSDLMRVQQLAGIQLANQPNEQVATETDTETTDDAMCQASAALDLLDQVLPGIRLADLKIIRQRLMAMQQKMNETVQPPLFGRLKKI